MNSYRFKNSREQGSITLFVAAVMLPTLFVLFSLSLDIGKYYIERAKLQKIIDDTAMYAHRYLPYTTAAKDAAKAYLARYKGVGENAEVIIDEDKVVIQLKANSKLVFASFFGYDADLPILAISRTRGTPFDTLILVDTSTYLSPVLPTGTVWPSAEDWPASDLFKEYEIRYEDDGVTHTLDEKLATLQCFNPAFSNLKMAAIRTYEYLSSLASNSVGVGFYPDKGDFLGLAQDVKPAPAPGTHNEVKFLPYKANFVDTVYCAAMAEDTDEHVQYQFPKASTKMEGLWAPPEGVPTKLIYRYIKPKELVYNEDYNGYLSVPQAIWSRVVRNQRHGDIQYQLARLRTLIATAKPVDARGGLINTPLKTGILFAGDVPYLGATRFPDGNMQSVMEEQLDLFKQDVDTYQFHLKLYYILFEHDGNKAGLSSRVSALKNFLANYRDYVGSEGGRFEVQLIYGSGASEVSEKLIAALALDKRSAVLSM